MTVNKRITYSFILMIAFLLSSTTTLFSQVSDIDNATQQDHIFDTITDLETMWRQSNEIYYFPNKDSYIEMRYIRMSQDGTKRYFIDILRDTIFDVDNYPITFQDTMIVDPMFLPIVFDGKIFVGDRLKKEPIKPLGKAFPLYSPLENHKNPFEVNEYDQKLRKKAYLDAILTNPHLVEYSYDVFPEETEAINSAPLEVNVFSDLFKVENTPDFSNVGGPTRFMPKRKYWIVKGQFQIQISESYISENWEKGGTGNTNLQSIQRINFDYRKGKFQNNNEIRWDLSFYTTYKNPTDSLRKTKIGTDVLRSYSDLGFKAFGDKWSYSTNLEIKTQLFNNYIENTNTRTASFMSPIVLNMGVLGMKYQLNKVDKKNKNRNISMNADISPLSISYTYIRNPEEVDPARYGIPSGENDLFVAGSMINSSVRVNFNKGVSLYSRFKCFTDYEKVRVETENELNLAINRYFSTRLYFYAIFDDRRERNNSYGYWQFNQVLSFGLNYVW